MPGCIRPAPASTLRNDLNTLNAYKSPIGALLKRIELERSNGNSYCGYVPQYLQKYVHWR